MLFHTIVGMPPWNGQASCVRYEWEFCLQLFCIHHSGSIPRACLCWFGYLRCAIIAIMCQSTFIVNNKQHFALHSVLRQSSIIHRCNNFTKMQGETKWLTLNKWKLGSQYKISIIPPYGSVIYDNPMNIVQLSQRGTYQSIKQTNPEGSQNTKLAKYACLANLKNWYS